MENLRENLEQLEKAYQLLVKLEDEVNQLILEMSL